MKTSKRKRSSKSEPETAALDAATAPAAEDSGDLPVAAEAPESVIEAVSDTPVAVQNPAVAEPVAVQIPAAAAGPDPVIVLAANCSVKDAATLKTSLCAVAEESTAVTLDASAVERVDTATMQLLCAFVRDRSARNQSIVWRGKSQALNDAVRLLGVQDLLGFEESKGGAA